MTRLLAGALAASVAVVALSVAQRTPKFVDQRLAGHDLGSMVYKFDPRSHYYLMGSGD